VDLTGEIVFVLGAERDGLPPEVLDRCDVVASIPQSAAAESLNVAMAGTIALYERRRRLA
jgi:tRNA G18 (ribose-2'-O)-methylase SpoU